MAGEVFPMSCWVPGCDGNATECRYDGHVYRACSDVHAWAWAIEMCLIEVIHGEGATAPQMA